MLCIQNKTTMGQSVKELKFYYQNWRGEASIRSAIPLKIWYGSTKWHPQEQWFIKAIDTEKGEERDFALIDMRFINNETL